MEGLLQKSPNRSNNISLLLAYKLKNIFYVKKKIITISACVYWLILRHMDDSWKNGAHLLVGQWYDYKVSIVAFLTNVTKKNATIGSYFL